MSSPVFHVIQNGDPTLAARLRNGSTVVGVETLNSRNDPTMTYEVQGGVVDAVPCRRLMSSSDSLYSVSNEYRSDWVSGRPRDALNLLHVRCSDLCARADDVGTTLSPLDVRCTNGCARPRLWDAGRSCCITH